ncbi:MAG: type I methionyl aminopeptidase [Elusimicrobia bacterium GWA2_56_46]|nr:MAG: type I methionyl aminopeptidase [Elusimicrobia bacterium GWA2_56_46]OGR55004.1 MAG: type I methionyl aminopeptidase [Elusimicrobia bacterium GWC2_56_31]HBW23986.1 type I methionyl aminopeptidase [Elusimicrobiota bacterium]
MVEIKTAAELALMRRASGIVAEVLALLKMEVRPGISTAELNSLAERGIRAREALPAFLGYRGYPAALCVSINEEVVHGIPDAKRIVRDGDLVSLDLGAVYRGFYGDAAITVAVGTVGPERSRLMEVTEASLSAALSEVRSGARLGDVCHAVEKLVTKNGMSVVREFTGHGIGRHLHEEPSIPNYGKPGTGVTLRPGMTLAIEPMVCLGNPGVVVKSDGWTAVSADGSCTAHFEHTVAVTEAGCEILSVISHG